MSNLRLQKRLAVSVKGCGKRKIWLDPTETVAISNANSRATIRKLLKDGIIIVKPGVVHSKSRIRKHQAAKFRGNHSGFGKRKGSKNARTNIKLVWQEKIRVLRRLLRVYRDKKKIDKHFYSMLYLKVKGNHFKNRRVLIEYIIKKNNEKKRHQQLKDQSEAHRMSRKKARQRRAERIQDKKQQLIGVSEDS